MLVFILALEKAAEKQESCSLSDVWIQLKSNQILNLKKFNFLMTLKVTFELFGTSKRSAKYT